mgnify:CR=1 FL=1
MELNVTVTTDILGWLIYCIYLNKIKPLLPHRITEYKLKMMTPKIISISPAPNIVGSVTIDADNEYKENRTVSPTISWGADNNLPYANNLATIPNKKDPTIPNHPKQTHVNIGILELAPSSKPIVPGFIWFKICKSLACFRVIGVRLVNMRLLIDLCKPLFRLRSRCVHHFKTAAKDDIFARPVLYVLIENDIKTVSLFESSAQGFKIFKDSVCVWFNIGCYHFIGKGKAFHYTLWIVVDYAANYNSLKFTHSQASIPPVIVCASFLKIRLNNALSL